MGFFGNLLKSGASPIGVDLGNANLKLAQVVTQDGNPILAAAANEPVPAAARSDPKARVDHFLGVISRMLSKNGFRGRRVVLGLPASFMYFHRLRMPQLDENAIKQAIAFQCVDHLPFHPSRALIRHVVAGDVYEDNEPRHEVIVMAAKRELTDYFLDAASKAKLEIVGVNPEPMAIGSCFATAETATSATTYVDIGTASTRIYIATGQKIQFARAVPIGADQFDQAIAQQLKVSGTDARRLRLQASAGEPGFGAVATNHTPVEQAMDAPLRLLLTELNLSVRYHRATFPSTPVAQVVFLGASAAHQRIWQKLGVELHLPTSAGDPLACVEIAEHLTEESDDNTPPSPAWAVPIGLSLGALSKAA